MSPRPHLRALKRPGHKGLAPFDPATLTQVRLDPKRKGGTKGKDAWYPYYAGFSSDFARAVLSTLPADITILDPWNGSGTTSCVASERGTLSVGVDLNPFACLLAYAKSAAFRNASEALDLALTAVRNRDTSKRRALADPLNAWLPAGSVTAFRSLRTSILRATGRSTSSRAKGAFLQLCLIKATRQLAAAKPGSNPTWVTPGELPDISSRDVVAGFRQTVEHLAPEAVAERTRFPTIIAGDSRQLPLADDSIDAIVTSPPYCTRIDYAVQTAFELACLGFDKETSFATLRHSLMGTTTIRERKASAIPNEWPSSVARLLRAVRRHTSYASTGYYYKNLWQYFSDAQRSLHEAARVLRPRGVAFLVVQTSYYKDLLIDLPALYSEMAERAGMSCRVLTANSIPGSRVMANLNPQAKRHLAKRSYTESVIVTEKR